jgi:hypothetical protein
MSLRRSRRADEGFLVVRYSRRWGVACLLFILALASTALEHGAPASTVSLVILALPAAIAAWCFLRARPVLVLDGSGLVFCRTGIRLGWSEIESVSIEEWQSPFDVSRRLVVRAVRPQLLEELWEGAPTTLGLAPPRDGQISLMLNFLAPRSKGIAGAIRECSGGGFEPAVRSVARSRLGAPGLGA